MKVCDICGVSSEKHHIKDVHLCAEHDLIFIQQRERINPDVSWALHLINTYRKDCMDMPDIFYTMLDELKEVLSGNKK